MCWLAHNEKQLARSFKRAIKAINLAQAGDEEVSRAVLLIHLVRLLPLSSRARVHLKKSMRQQLPATVSFSESSRVDGHTLTATPS